jgi:hypothetical protein
MQLLTEDDEERQTNKHHKSNYLQRVTGFIPGNFRAAVGELDMTSIAIDALLPKPSF